MEWTFQPRSKSACLAARSVVGTKKGWNLIVGGSSTRRPRVGDTICEGLPEEEVIPLIKRTLEYYRDRGKKLERMARFVDRIGIENLKDALVG